MTDLSPFDQFWSKVHKTTTCWLWTGRRDSGGYGEIRFGAWRRPGTHYERAHRLSYEMFVGPIPDGLVIDHLCRVRRCVNPAHLEAVTNRENIRRGDTGKARGLQQRAATHCTHGHEFTPENTYLRQGKWRQCRTCARQRSDRHRKGA